MRGVSEDGRTDGPATGLVIAMIVLVGLAFGAKAVLEFPPPEWCRNASHSTHHCR